MYSYTELLNKFNRSTRINKESYKLENNTWVIRQSNYENIFYIQLHGSYIAKIESDKIVLDNCGYSTHTTKDRLNKILNDNQVNYRIYQDNFTWYVWFIHHYNKQSIGLKYDDTKIKFYNGITFIYRLNLFNGNGWYINGQIE